jgi:hypothetical protein
VGGGSGRQNANVLGPGGVRCQPLHRPADVAQELGGGLGVDLFPGVGGLVVIAVQSGEEEQDRDLLGGERSMVAGAVAGGFGQIEFEAFRLGELLQQVREAGAGAGAGATLGSACSLVSNLR